MLLQVLDHRPMGRQSKSLVHNMLSERDVHGVAFRLHNEFAGNIAQPACRASERDICQRLIDLNASIHQREGHDVLARPKYPWKWYRWLDGQPSAYFEFKTVGKGTILHKEHLKHFCISASSSLSLGKDMPIHIPQLMSDVGPKRILDYSAICTVSILLIGASFAVFSNSSSAD